MGLDDVPRSVYDGGDSGLVEERRVTNRTKTRDVTTADPGIGTVGLAVRLCNRCHDRVILRDRERRPVKLPIDLGRVGTQPRVRCRDTLDIVRYLTLDGLNVLVRREPSRILDRAELGDNERNQHTVWTSGDNARDGS